MYIHQKFFMAFFCICWLLMVVIEVAESRSMASSPIENEEENAPAGHSSSTASDDTNNQDFQLEGDDVIVEENPHLFLVKRSTADAADGDEGPTSSEVTSVSINWKEIILTLSLVVQKLLQSLYQIIKRFFDSYSESIVSFFRDRVLPSWLFFSSFVLQNPTVRSALAQYSTSVEWRPAATALFESLVKLSHHQPQLHNNIPQ